MKKRIIALLMCCTAICCTFAAASALGFTNILTQSITASAAKHTCRPASQYVVDKKPTCTTKGKGHYNCAICNKRLSNVTIPTKSHSMHPNKVITPTCTSKGYDEWKCSYCSKTEKKNYKNAYGHKYGSYKVTKQPTCETKGQKYHQCTRRGCNYKEYATIPAKGHSMHPNKVITPTCTSKGYDEWKCSYCSKTEKKNYKNAYGHSGTWKVTKKATCTSNGTQTRKCTRSKCSVTETKTIKATGHAYKWETTKKATCTSAGTESYKCSTCKHVQKTRTIKATGHTYKWETTKKATCTNAGTESYKCSKCKHVQKTKTIKALGHNYKKKSSQGRNYKQCQNCNDKLYTAEDYKKDFKAYLKDKGFSTNEVDMIFNYMNNNGGNVSSSSFDTLMNYIGKIGEIGDLAGNEYVSKLSTISTAGTLASSANSYFKALSSKNGEAVMDSFIDLTSNICDLCPLTKGYSKVLTSLKSSINDVIKAGKKHNYQIYYTDICCFYGTPTLAELSQKSKYDSFVKYCKNNFGKDADYVVDYYIQDLINEQFKAATGKTLDEFFELFNK